MYRANAALAARDFARSRAIVRFGGSGRRTDGKEGMALFAQILIDIAHTEIDRLFTYRIPEGLRIEPGMHVLVPFGRGNAQKEGFVLGVSQTSDGAGPYKEILRALEPYPILLPDQIALARWMQRSYNCLLVDALRLMIPAQICGGRVHEKIDRTVSLAPELDAQAALASLCDKSGRVRAAKQHEVLKLLAESRAEMSVSDISAFIPGASAAISALVRRGYVVESGHVTFRRPLDAAPVQEIPVSPTPAQASAVGAVCAALDSGASETFLLHGVTGSGKTEVYLRCIEHCIRSGRQAIMLVPEIALTPQTVGRFRARFSDDIAVLHSRLSAGERFDEWRRIRLGRAKVAVGARSAVFAPFERLGLIVIDEEHEGSYQSENTPRYHATEIALHRAAASGAPLLLGSATPSLLSYFRACSGRYRLLELPERVMHRPLPEVEIVDMREEFLSGNNGIFSGRLVQLLGECLQDGKQAMLFLNRRGYSTFVSCRACGAVIQCPNCDISMTYHKAEHRLKCHFCGASAPIPLQCPVCGKPFIKYFGIGTEQVEEQLRALFPGVRSLRMDTDTMRKKESHAQMLASFASGEAQVLIGTQMIAKGHDFPNVTLVGVVAADATLCIPDYRSTERTFQLLTQVSGRAGRDESPGRVVVQTYMPNHPAIRFAKAHDYAGFYHYELAERRKALFPPYSLFLRILFSGPDEDALTEAGERYGARLEEEIRALLGQEGAQDLLLLVSSPAPIRRKQGNYRYQVLIKLLRTKRTASVIRLVYDFATAHRNELFALLEVNPQDMF